MLNARKPVARGWAGWSKNICGTFGFQELESQLYICILKKYFPHFARQCSLLVLHKGVMIDVAYFLRCFSKEIFVFLLYTELTIKFIYAIYWQHRCSFILQKSFAKDNFSFLTDIYD